VKFEIKSRWDGSIKFEGEFRSFKLCVVAAVKSDADLRGAVLTPIRDDFWAILSAAPAEVPALIEALKAGKVNGSTYEGECACLVGTIANARKCNYAKIPGLTPNSHRPAEAFFTAIKPGALPRRTRRRRSRWNGLRSGWRG